MPDAICSIPNCGGPFYAFGWCQAHYRRWKTTGNLQPEVPIRRWRRACSIPGCASPHKARGWCAHHYNLWHVSGDPETGRTMKPLAARFATKFAIDSTSGCWVWIGATSHLGYGSISTGGRGPKIGAHRASWLIHHGPIPEGMEVCHRCDNPPCVNPDHLWLGSRAENHADMWSKGRGRSPHAL